MAEIDPDLVEWNYGEYEGRTTADIRLERPDWQLFRDGCPGDESPQQMSARADRVVRRVRAVADDVLLFSSGHFIRILAARWIGAEQAVNAAAFMLSTASLSALGYEQGLSRPVIRLWNDTNHVLQAAKDIQNEGIQSREDREGKTQAQAHCSRQYDFRQLPQWQFLQDFQPVADKKKEAPRPA